MTTQKLVVQEQPDLLAAVEKLDAEIKAILEQMRETNERMRQENERLRQQLGLAPREAVNHG